MRASGVSPVKRGNRSLFDEEMVAALDEQHRKLQQGFSLRDTTKASHQTLDITPVTQTSLEPAPDQGLALLVSALSDALRPTPDTNPLRSHDLLQRAADNDWLLTSRQLSECLGVSAATTHHYNSVEERLGFRLTRAGRGVWKVSVASSSESDVQLRL